MERFNRSRQLLMFDPAVAVPITIIGAGGIGSTTALMLAKMGIPKLTVWDFDTVDDVNLPSQMYGPSHLGLPKVEALADVLASFSDCDVTTHESKYVDQPLKGIVISAVDKMHVRKAIWQRAKLNPAVKLIIDPRMGGQAMDLFTARTCQPKDITHYEQHLFSDDEASPLTCGEEAIVYNTFGIATMISAIVRQWLTNETAPSRIVGDFDTLSFTTIPTTHR